MMETPRMFTLHKLLKVGRPFSWLAFVACAVALSGCNRGPAMYQVQGKVAYTDGSIPRGGVCVIRFQPSEESTAEVRKGATADIQPDGSFAVSTRKAGDGAYEGEYAVTFAIRKSDQDARPQVSPKYTNPKLTPYKVMVDRNLYDLKFEIEPLPGVSGAPAAG